MKRNIAASFLVFGLMALSITPANAVFGLSKCEKVHKEMKSIEGKFLADYKKIRAYAVDDNGTSVLSLSKASVAIIEKLKNQDPIPKIWKLAFNNPSCFSNSQNIQVKNLSNKTITNYFDWVSWQVYSSTPKCKSLYANGKKYDQATSGLCIKSTIQKWAPVAEYRSIYSY